MSGCFKIFLGEVTTIFRPGFLRVDLTKEEGDQESVDKD